MDLAKIRILFSLDFCDVYAQTIPLSESRLRHIYGHCRLPLPWLRLIFFAIWGWKISSMAGDLDTQKKKLVWKLNDLKEKRVEIVLWFLLKEGGFSFHLSLFLVLWAIYIYIKKQWSNNIIFLRKIKGYQHQPQWGYLIPLIQDWQQSWENPPT